MKDKIVERINQLKSQLGNPEIVDQKRVEIKLEAYEEMLHLHSAAEEVLLDFMKWVIKEEQINSQRPDLYVKDFLEQYVKDGNETPPKEGMGEEVSEDLKKQFADELGIGTHHGWSLITEAAYQKWLEKKLTRPTVSEKRMNLKFQFHADFEDTNSGDSLMDYNGFKAAIKELNR